MGDFEVYLCADKNDLAEWKKYMAWEGKKKSKVLRG